MSLPKFTYHPDPVATGSIEVSDAECLSCEQARGYIYVCNTYSEEEIEEAICPWCIADGSASEKFEATFSDDAPLVDEGIDEEIVEEVTRRTPGFFSWQQDVWLCCCDDACEFHGDPSREQLAKLKGSALEEVLEQFSWTEEEWADFLKVYEPGESPAIYHFICRHCRKSRYGMDTD
ncbi:MAG TPA: CbrC family protein [Chthoniobacter sp.]|nr:CbrC family protein [Chthoniobacter sp.]